MIAHRFHHGKGMVEAAFGKIVEEQPAHPARFVAVLEEEVVIAPSLEARMQSLPKRCQGLPTSGVKMHRVILETVVGGQIHAAPKPPHRLLSRLFGDEQANVHVYRGRIGIARVQDQRQSHRFPSSAGQLRPVGRSRGW